VPGPAEAGEAFDNAWTFCAVCLAVAGLGCLAISRLRGEDDLSKSPSLGSSVRLLIGSREAPAAVEPEAAQPAAPAASSEPIQHRPESPADFLARVPIFAGLPERAHRALAERSTSLHLSAGDWLFRAGEEATVLYVVRVGRLEVVEEESGAVLRVLGRGAALGELGLLTSTPRSASVRAARNSELIAIDRADFERLLAAESSIALALARTLGSQLRDSAGAPAQARSAPVTIALVGLNQGDRVDDMAHSLLRSLGRWGRVDLIDGARAGQVAHADGAAAFGPMLDAAEQANDRLLLVGGSAFDWDPWTEFCIQQADRILAIGSGGEPTPARASRPELRGCDLVALDVAEGSGVLSGWAATLEPTETHAIRAQSAGADVDRLARRLTGNSVGAVLAGGGARAFSHIGVLDELLRAGVVIDRVGGVSMGAFIGAMFAMGMDPAEIDARCYEEWVRRRPLSDYTLPRHSLIRGERTRAMLDRTFGATTIEELGRGYFSGATELRSGELVVMRSGPLWEAVGLSFCLPILAPVQVRGRQLLVDGALVDNLPVATMAELGEGPVIAVDVKASFERPPSSSSAIRGAGEPQRRQPSMMETLGRVLLLSSADTAEAARRYADWTITSRTPGVGLLEFHQMDQAIESGRLAAREALEHAPRGIFG
jgi:NTE family protein